MIGTAHDDDRRLIGRAREGDEKAFRALIERHRGRVYAIARQIVGNADDARDVAQEVFVKLHLSRDAYDGSSLFTTWLYRLTVNAAIDHRRKHRRRDVPLDDLDREPPDGSTPSQPYRAVEADELRRLIEHIAGGLSGSQQAVFVLRDLQEFTTREAAAILGCRASTVRVHLAAARNRIRDMLLKRYPGYVNQFGTTGNDR